MIIILIIIITIIKIIITTIIIYDSTYHFSTVKQAIDADSLYFWKIETNVKPCKPKAGDRVRIIKCKNIFSKDYTDNMSKELFVIDSVLKSNPWMY